jgi:acetyl-CoA C-acetyltransferase
VKSMERIAIVSAVRTPIGGYLGALRDVPAYDLVAAVLNEIVKRANVKPEEVEDVIFGQCYQSGEYVNIARRALLQAGWPVTVPGITLDRRCTSGLDALVIGAMQIQTGMSKIVAAGGVESMSSAEFYIPGNIKWGIGRGSGISFPDAPRGHGSLKMFGIPIYDRIQRSSPMHQPAERFGEIVSNMAWAENVAKEIGLTREECDKWSLRSNQRAVAAQQSGRLKDYIIPISIPQEKGDPRIVDTDEGPRAIPPSKPIKVETGVGGVCTPATLLRK